MQKLKRGDVVRLKSGGPNMTVLEYYVNEIGGIYNALQGKKEFDESVETTLVVCKWFDKNIPMSG